MGHDLAHRQSGENFERAALLLLLGAATDKP
jgi:hypothetical protein